MNVLIIDDDAPWANLAAVMLRKVASKIRVAGTWKDALDTIAKPNGYDVVMVDLNLPDSGAETTLRRVAEIKCTGRKVVLMTGADVTEYMKDIAIQFGAEDLLYKGALDFPDKVRAACQ